MKDLFIELHLGEDVDVLLAKLVRSRGFIAHTTQEAGCSGASDPEQRAYAASRGRTLLTHNRAHFTELAKYYFSIGQHHAGIIIAVRRPPHQILRRLLEILNHVTADEMRDQVRYI